MGNDAKVYMFDEARYRDEVVPDFLALLAGYPPPWLANLTVSGDPEFMSDVLDYVSRHPADLARHCTYLQSDLAYEPTLLRLTWREGFDARACRSTSCTERERCPYHWAQAEGFRSPTDSFNAAFERAVVERCLGRSQFVGRTVSALTFYDGTLTAFAIPSDSRTRVLLQRLGSRGLVVGYGFSNGDGVHGWLSTVEAGELARNLDELDLPRYEPTFEAMAALLQRHQLSAGPGEPSFEMVSLSFVRTVATIASAQGRGILWGNDLPTIGAAAS